MILEGSTIRDYHYVKLDTASHNCLLTVTS